MERFGLYPERLAGDSAYGVAEMLGWLVEEQDIEPHAAIIDMGERDDGIFSRCDFDYNHEKDIYFCPTGEELKTRRRSFEDRPGDVHKDGMRRFRALKADC